MERALWSSMLRRSFSMETMAISASCASVRAESISAWRCAMAVRSSP
jgi:hypothetical protein